MEEATRKINYDWFEYISIEDRSSIASPSEVISLFEIE